MRKTKNSASSVARRRYTPEFKRDAVAQLATSPNATALAAQLGIRRKFLYQWRAQLARHGEQAFHDGPGRPPQRATPLTPAAVPVRPAPTTAPSASPRVAALERRVAELERALGRKQLEADFFRQHLRACQGSEGAAHRVWRDAVYEHIQASLSSEGERLTVDEQCRLAGVSRAGFYRYLHRVAPREEDLLVRERLQQLALAHHRRYGYRPLTALLRREGLVVNSKRVRRLLNEDNLLCLRQHKFVLTTDSRHELPVYRNLVPKLTLDGLNQLWVADLTYIRLGYEFLYLAVVLDAYSRKVIGWALGRTLEAALPLAALRQAIATRTWAKGTLVHHSDRGVQYASKEMSRCWMSTTSTSA